MSLTTGVRDYLGAAFRWQRGRQKTGYDKMLLVTAGWPIPFDTYLLRYPEGSEIPPHIDRVERGRHYRLNIVVKRSQAGGQFVFAAPLFASRRVNLFRSDACEHSGTRRIRGG